LDRVARFFFCRGAGRKSPASLQKELAPCQTKKLSVFEIHLISAFLEQFNFEKVGLLHKYLPVNSCREMLAGGFCPPSSKHLKAKRL
jgi:hypothetical protein